MIERFYLDFIRQGAKFDESKQQQYAHITETLARLQTQFAQKVLADESNVYLELKRSDLEGCPDDLIAAMKQAAKDTKKVCIDGGRDCMCMCMRT